MCDCRPNSYEIYKSRRWGDCTFARASPASLSRNPLSLDIEATPKTDLSLSRSLVDRQTWRLTGDNLQIAVDHNDEPLLIIVTIHTSLRTINDTVRADPSCRACRAKPAYPRTVSHTERPAAATGHLLRVYQCDQLAALARLTSHGTATGADSLEVLGEVVPTAVGPRPREGVVVQHPRHDEVDLVGARVLLALGVVVVGKVEAETETNCRQHSGRLLHERLLRRLLRSPSDRRQ